MTSEGPKKLAKKMRRAYGETGVFGIARRTTRVILDRIRDTSDRWSKELLYSEMERRLDDRAQELLARNVQFKEKHRGQRAFVIGTGPSLNTQNLSLLKDEITIGVNSLWRHPVMQEWNPTYFLVTDGVSFSGTPATDEFLRGLAANVPKSQLIVPVEHRKLIEERNLLPLDRTHFIALDGWLYHGLTDDVDLTRLNHFPNTVAQSAILCAVYMGASPIYLLGLDHNWMEKPNIDSHFHQGTPIGTPWRPKAEFNYRNYGILAKFVNLVWTGYEIIQPIAEKHNVKIINATRGGFLDLFPRIEFEELFPKK